MRVLVVEDDPDMSSILRRGLCEEGWDVDVAGTGQAGLQLALTGDPDVVVLDLGLPGLDGLTVLAPLRECAWHRPGPGLPAPDSATARARGPAQGAAASLANPFPFRNLPHGFGGRTR